MCILMYTRKNSVNIGRRKPIGIKSHKNPASVCGSQLPFLKHTPQSTTWQMLFTNYVMFSNLCILENLQGNPFWNLKDMGYFNV